MNAYAERKCGKLRETYTKCMDAWYTSTFMKGDMTPAPCDDDFEDYQLCVVAAHREWMTGEKVIEDDDDAGD